MALDDSSHAILLVPGVGQESREYHKSTRPYDNSALKKHHIPQDMPSAKRHRPTTSTRDELRTHSVPLTGVSSPIVPVPRPLSTPRSSPRQRLVMECVEVVPLREFRHRQAAEAGGDKRKQQQRSDLDDHASKITPERPFVPRAVRELQEKDEIGKSLSRTPKVNVMSWNYCYRRTVPETPDAVLRPVGIGSSKRFLIP